MQVLVSKTGILVTGCSFVCHFITFITFDQLGRGNSLFLGSMGLAASMLETGGAIESSPTVANLSSEAKNASSTLLILWYCIYGFTWVPGCWIVTREIGIGQLRERTVFPAFMGSFLTSAPINFMNPYVQSAIGAESLSFTGPSLSCHFSLCGYVYLKLVGGRLKS